MFDVSGEDVIRIRSKGLLRGKNSRLFFRAIRKDGETPQFITNIPTIILYAK